MELTIARNDGHETNWLHEVESILTTDEMHEFILWSNGAMSIDGLVGDTFEDDKVRLDLAGLRQLRNFLTSAKVTALLDTATS